MDRIRSTHLVGHILGYHALLLLDAPQIVRVLPAELGRQRDHDSGKPHQEYHGEHTTTRTGVNIIHVSHYPVTGEKRIEAITGTVNLNFGRLKGALRGIWRLGLRRPFMFITCHWERICLLRNVLSSLYCYLRIFEELWLR